MFEGRSQILTFFARVSQIDVRQICSCHVRKASGRVCGLSLLQLKLARGAACCMQLARPRGPPPCRRHPHVCLNVLLQLLLDGHPSYTAWRDEQIARSHRSFLLSEARYKARRAAIEEQHERAKRFNSRHKTRTPPCRRISCSSSSTGVVASSGSGSAAEVSPEKTAETRPRVCSTGG